MEKRASRLADVYYFTWIGVGANGRTRRHEVLGYRPPGNGISWMVELGGICGGRRARRVGWRRKDPVRGLFVKAWSNYRAWRPGGCFFIPNFHFFVAFEQFIFPIDQIPRDLRPIVRAFRPGRLVLLQSLYSVGDGFMQAPSAQG